MVESGYKHKEVKLDYEGEYTAVGYDSLYQSTKPTLAYTFIEFGKIDLRLV